MKVSFLLTAILIIISGCRLKNHESEKTGSCEGTCFLLSGQLTNGENRYLFIQEPGNAGHFPPDSLILGNSGYFNEHLPLDQPSFLRVRNDHGDFIIIFPEPSDTIIIYGDYDNLLNYQVRGNNASEAIAELHMKTQAFMEKVDQIAGVTRDSLESDGFAELKFRLKNKYDSLYSDFRNYSLRFIQKHRESPVALIALHNQIGHGTRVFDMQKDFEIFAMVDSFLHDKYLELPMVKELHDRLNVIRLQTSSRHQGSRPAPGETAPEISLPDTSGIVQKLSSLKGRIVLVDFWASWSPPGRLRNIDLKDLYKKWGGKEFEIFQIGIEQNREQWINAIREDELHWISVSDFRFWGSPVSHDYGVNSLPSSFLIDKEGFIIGIDLSADKIDEILNNMLKY